MTLIKALEYFLVLTQYVISTNSYADKKKEIERKMQGQIFNTIIFLFN